MKRFFNYFLLCCLIAVCFVLTAPNADAATAGVLTYEIKNNEAIITGCDTNASGLVVVPETLDGFPVVELYDTAFTGCAKITGISLPASIKRLGCFSVFSGCTSLEDLYITDLSAYCKIFRGLGSSFPPAKNLYINGQLVRNLVIPEGISTIQFGLFWGYTCFYTITIPDSVTSIESNAFNSCTNLVSVKIGSGLQKIDSDAFSNCGKLTTITLPQSLASLSGRSFDGCNSLKHVFYSADRIVQHAIKNILSETTLYNATWHYEVSYEKYNSEDCILCPDCNAYYQFNGEKISNIASTTKPTTKPATSTTTKPAATTTNSVTPSTTSSNQTTIQPVVPTLTVDKASLSVGEFIYFFCSPWGENCTLWIFNPNGTTTQIDNVSESHSVEIQKPGTYSAVLHYTKDGVTHSSQIISFQVTDTTSIRNRTSKSSGMPVWSVVLLCVLTSVVSVVTTCIIKKSK